MNFRVNASLVCTIVLGTMFAFPSLAATNVIYPLSSWHVTVRQGEEIGEGLYHMGIDAGRELGAGAPVYAVADGTVKEARERSQFGLVVLIEHTIDGDKKVSLYGHLDPTELWVTPGQKVKAGDVIGVLGTSENNGGWPSHIHFGIHNQPYTGEWVYYGHVRNPKTAEQWHDPETYIPEHLVADTWAPTLSWDLMDNQVVGNTMSFTVNPRDVGSGIRLLQYNISQDNGLTWSTVYETNTVYGNQSVTLPLYEFPDGPLTIQVTVSDNFDQQTTLETMLEKDPDRYTVPLLLAIKGKKSDGFVTQWSKGGTALEAFFPFGEQWSNGGDIAVGQLQASGDQEIVVATGSSKKPGKLSIFTLDGKRRTVIKRFKRGALRVATGDVNNDGVDEIIVGSGAGRTSELMVLRRDGTQVWSIQPFGIEYRTGVNVASADMNGDNNDDIIVSTRASTRTGGRTGTGARAQTMVAVYGSDGSNMMTTFRPFGKKYHGGATVAAGDINGDGTNEIVVGTEQRIPAIIRAFDQDGNKLGMTIAPFGDLYIGAIDVSTTQWYDTDAQDAVLVSQADTGQAWVKLYYLYPDVSVLFNKRLYEEEFMNGTRITGWPN